MFRQAISRFRPLVAASVRSHSRFSVRGTWQIHSMMTHFPADEGTRIFGSSHTSSYLAWLCSQYGRTYQVDFDLIGAWWLRQDHAHQSPIAEIGVGLHQNGQVSTVVIPKVGAYSVLAKRLPDLSSIRQVPASFTPHGRQAVRGAFAMLSSVRGELQPFHELIGSMSEGFQPVADMLANVRGISERFNPDELSEHHQLMNAFSEEAMTHIDMRQFREDNPDRDAAYIAAFEAIQKRVTQFREKHNWFTLFPYQPLPNDHYQVCSHIKIDMTQPTTRFNHDLHRSFPKGRTPLGDAILNNDKDKVEALLLANPMRVFQQDAFGRRPLELAIYGADKAIFNLLFEVASKQKINCEGLLNHIEMFRSPYEYPITYDRFHVSKDANLADILKDTQKKRPSRSPIHEACLSGDLVLVKTLIKADKELINLPDPWGITPIFLATGMGHTAVIAYLFEQGASRWPISPHDGHAFGIYQLNHYGLLESAPNPNTIQTLLRYGVSPNEKGSLAIQAIYDRDFEKLKWLYRYERDERPNIQGLTPLDIAIYTTSYYINDCYQSFGTGSTLPEDVKSQIETSLLALKWLLSFKEEPLFRGPYDSWVPREVVDIFQTFNQRIDKKQKVILSRPKLMCDTNIQYHASSRILKSELAFHDTPFKLSLKSTADLSDRERDEVYALYHRNFDKLVDNTAEGKARFLSQTFPKERENVYVELSRHRGKIIGFMVFQTFKTHHEEKDIDVFYGKLAVMDKSYLSQGLVNYTFRLPLAMKLYEPSRTLWVYYKSIRPGGSWLLADTNGSKVYPKYHHNEDLMRHLVSCCGDELQAPGRVTATSVVKRSGPESQKIQEFYDLAGPDESSALPVAYEVTNSAIDSYLSRKLDYSGCTHTNLLTTGCLFSSLLRDNQTCLHDKVVLALKAKL